MPYPLGSTVTLKKNKKYFKAKVVGYRPTGGIYSLTYRDGDTLINESVSEAIVLSPDHKPEKPLPPRSGLNWFNVNLRNGITASLKRKTKANGE